MASVRGDRGRREPGDRLGARASVGVALSVTNRRPTGLTDRSSVHRDIGVDRRCAAVISPTLRRRRVLDPAIYREAASRLDRHFSISIVDCGSTLDSPVTQEALRDIDALIVASSPWVDGASAAAQIMEWLANHGLTALLHRTVVVLNDSDGHADRRGRAPCWRTSSPPRKRRTSAKIDRLRHRSGCCVRHRARTLGRVPQPALPPIQRGQCAHNRDVA